MAIEIGKIRNVGVVGHGGVGKTSLVEGLLFTAGALTRLGKVDDGSTTTDFDPDEIKRRISINTAVAYCDWKGHRINLVDTPGYGDFIADARAGLRVVEAAIVVVDAVAGVQVQTEKVWKFATEYALPRAVVVNRLDRERADFYRTLESLARRLKGRLVALQIPLGEESSFRGYVDLVRIKAVTYANGKASEGEVPGDLSDRVKEYRERLVEAAAETDDELLSKYLEEGSLGEPEMLRALRAGIAGGKLVPVLCASAARNLGSAALLDLVVDSLPSPADRGDVAGTDLKAKQPGTRSPEPKAPVAALVFKTLSDPHIGKLSLFRVYSGTLRADATLVNASRSVRECMGHVSWLMGKTQKNVEALGPGEIGVAQKLKYNVDVNLLPPRIPYKETVRGRAEGQGKYKKQTGGRGQYGDVWLRVEPLPRGGGFEFVDEIFGGAVPRNYIPSAEKGVRDCMKKGILAGYPIVDLRVILYDGTYHEVDSSDMAFQIAASLGLQKVFLDAHPILLEPIMNVEVTCPSDAAGDIIGDLNSRRGRIVGMEPAGETAAVRATVPMAERLTYESSLRSMTGASGAL